MNLKKTVETEYESIDSSLTKEIQITEKEHFLADRFRVWNTDEGSQYISAQKILKKISYTKEDITAFSLYLSYLENEIDLSFAGIFLSVLINEHYEKTEEQNENKKKNTFLPYKILTSHLETEIDNIGFRNNGAQIEITGSVGSGLGAYMQAGEIIVYGNCNSSAGFCMRGGTINIKGRAGDAFGNSLQGGTLFAEETGILCGENMQSGIIHVAEKYSFGKHGMLLAAGGEIYFNNEKKYPIE